MDNTSQSQMQTKILKTIILSIVFLSLTCLLYLGFRQDQELIFEKQRLFFSLGFSALISGLATLMLSVHIDELPLKPRKWWFFPLMSALLGLSCMSLAYIYLGVWPLGDRSVMIVDMHHQYAPLLSQLRDMLLHGGSPLYSFDVGLGSSFLPLFGYYLASPFNLILALFPKEMLNEGILVITLLKNAFTAGFFALCVQYLFRRRDLSVLIVSILYSMMMYLLAYSWNVMWLDCVMVLPLVVMSFERLMKTGKYLPYVLSLAYVLYTNYYIAFMICLFMVLYFIMTWVRQQETTIFRARSLGRFMIGSILGGGLAMFLLVPVYLSLSNTSAAGGTLPDIKNNFDMFNLLGQHLYETTPTIRSGNLPNLYCGLLSFLLLPVYATMKSISLRRRAAHLGLMGIMAVSLVINRFDLIWHGLHAPNDLPYRFSFLYSFVLILIAYETIVNINKITLRQIALSFTGILSWLMLYEKLGGDDIQFGSVYASLLLLVIYALILGLVALRKMTVRPAYTLLLIVVAVEMVMNGSASFKTMQSKEYFTARADYVANDITKSLDQAVERTEKIGSEAANGAFYRMEFLPRRTTDDTAMFDYHGMTVFASSSPQNLTEFMGYIGYAVNGVNSHLYKSYVPITDSLLGIKYLMLDSAASGDLSSNPYLRYVDEITYGASTYFIYENTKALPLGYFAESSISGWIPSKYDPFTSQNALYGQLLNKPTSLYTMGTIYVDSANENIASVSGTIGFSISPVSNYKTATFNVTVAQDGQTYTYVDCRAAETIQVTTGNNTWSIPAHEPYTIYTGNMKQGDQIRVTVTAKDACSGNVYVGTMNQDVFENALNTLSANPLNVKSHTDTKITGDISAPHDGVVFTTVPFDKGWTVTVDGKKAETFAAGDAMLAFEVGAGQHTVEMRFFTVGLVPGIVISLLSLILLITLLMFIHKKVDKNNPDDNEFSALLRLIAPYDPVMETEEADGVAENEPSVDTPSVPIEENSASPLTAPETEDTKGEQAVDHDSDAGL